uniref:Zinc knuckle CX2CX4HX4C domain-containing protein n=1 Tax=Cannabis sativa TaxID=3483 RepID=A0A803QG00_CANSA
MDSILHNMESSLVLSEKERTVHSLSEADLAAELAEPRFFLVARCLSTTFNPQTFTKKMGEFRSNKCRFPKICPRCNSGCKFIVCLFSINPEYWHGRVKLDISHPLMRGKLVNLPKVRDEHWIEFRYESLPIFCFHCGRIEHPFEKCTGFMELVDAGLDPDLPYGPSMMGDKLPVTGYDRYRIDFQLPSLSLAFPTTPADIPTSSNKHTQSHPNSASQVNVFATYPPSDVVNGPGLTTLFSDSTITSFKVKGKAIMTDEVILDGTTLTKTFKRHVDPGNLRSILKRFRNNNTGDNTFNEFCAQQVSDAQSDSNENNSFFFQRRLRISSPARSHEDH